jgi:nucleoside 2-deoxyribosyltransferase
VWDENVLPKKWNADMYLQMKTIYLIGSLRNQRIIEIAEALRRLGYDVFDEWIAVGPEADEYWQRYERARGRTYVEALSSYHAKHVFDFDKYHLDRADIVILVMPAGKSAHLELGYAIGRGKRGYILLEKDFDEQENIRFDIMYGFAHGVFYDLASLIADLEQPAREEPK